ncbi:hypothetical protein ACGFXB_43545 [Streptomyces canus]|uniref:hypothetical protein n=1 Tax=Streptomyces canus TaxID=58343 RepID=UPI00371D2F05
MYQTASWGRVVTACVIGGRRVRVEPPSAAAVQRVHDRTGHAADEIHPVPPIV